MIERGTGTPDPGPVSFSYIIIVDTGIVEFHWIRQTLIQIVDIIIVRYITN